MASLRPTVSNDDNDRRSTAQQSLQRARQKAADAIGGVVSATNRGRRQSQERARPGWDAMVNYKPGSGTTYGGDPGFSGVTRELLNGFQSLQNALGWGSTVRENGGRQAPYGGGMGDALFGAGDKLRSTGTRQVSQATTPKQGGSLANAGSSLPQGMNFEDALSRVAGLLGGMGGGGEAQQAEVTLYDKVNYDPQRQQTRGNYDGSRASIGSIYDQLARENTAANQRVEQGYDTSRKEVQQATNAASDQIEGVYQAAANDQNAMLKQLGIQDAVAQTIEEGRDLQGQGASAVAATQQAGQRDLAYNTQTGNAADEYGETMQRAGETGRSTQLAGLEQLLQSRLAEIDQEESSANQQIDMANTDILNQASLAASQGSQGTDPTDIFSMAMQLLENDQSQQSSAMDQLLTQYQMEQEAAEAQQKATSNDPLTRLAQYQKLQQATKGAQIPEELLPFFLTGKAN